MNTFLDEFLRQLAWPAVAGNVAWSFATLTISPNCDARADCSKEDILSRLGVLLVLAVYLSAEWYFSKDSKSKDSKNTPAGLWLDLLFVVCIVWFAIATQAGHGLPGVALLVILVVAGVGHICGVWPPAGSDMSHMLHGLVSLAAACSLGTVWWANGLWSWNVALIDIVIVLVHWACVRAPVRASMRRGETT